MKRSGIFLLGSLALLAASPAGAVCKMIINVDRTGSMDELSADGRSRCSVAQNSVLLILDAYWRGLDFNLLETGNLAKPRVEIDTNCPAGSNYLTTANTRLVQVREFQGDVMQPLWLGFKPVNEAYQFMVQDSGWYDAFGISLDSCPGPATPMAQAMCRAARVFSLTPPASEFRIVKMATDGQENHSDIVPIDTAAGETRCRLPGDSTQIWQDRVLNEYTSRNIVFDGDLFAGISLTLQGPSAEKREPVAEARGHVEGNTAPLSSMSLASDRDFFSAMSVSTGGRFSYVEPTTPIASAATQSDSDNDGIPDYRDQCVGACASDADQDGIPDANDVCPFLDEDGRAPVRTDGCPDTDSDGFRNGVDQCPTSPEDLLAPYPNDGCPAAAWNGSATPNLKTVDNATVCTSLNVTSTTGAASVAKLDISGTHAYRAVLRGTLSHNGTTVEAFPVNTFPVGSGTFSFTNRPIAMPAGAAAGSWTLCITDTDGFGDTGVLTNWSVHN